MLANFGYSSTIQYMSNLHETGTLPGDPELLGCQINIKSLCDDVLALKPEGSPLTFWEVSGDVEPETILEKLRNIRSLGRILLYEGESLSAPSGGERYPDLGIFATNAILRAVSIRAWGWEDDKWRINPGGPDKPPYDVIRYPGEKDWIRQSDIVITYSDGKQSAIETISIYTGSRIAGTLPSFTRDVWAMEYAETGYEGHNKKSIKPEDEAEIEEFIDIAKSISKPAA